MVQRTLQDRGQKTGEPWSQERQVVRLWKWGEEGYEGEKDDASGKKYGKGGREK
jgi:hypothetical protein